LKADGAVHLLTRRREGAVAVQSALAERRSIRSYTREPLALAEVSDLLWAAQGISELREGHRTAPSAGALYPLEVHLVAGNVDGLEAGIYTYAPREHAITCRILGDLRVSLRTAAWDQHWVGTAPVVMALAAVYSRTTAKYGERGIRYVHIEAGHAAQNVALQATALGLGSAVVGAFQDAAVASVLGLEAAESPLLLLPVGRQSDSPQHRGSDIPAQGE
jgi:SagB-type dehydrogenase family enzyme